MRIRAGQAITSALRNQRRRDIHRIYAETRWLFQHGLYYRFGAWCMFGWHITKPGGFGIPGANWPWWDEPKWRKG